MPMSNSPSDIPTCAICQKPISGRIVFCPQHWMLISVPIQRSLANYSLVENGYGQDSVQFIQMRDIAIRAAYRRLERSGHTIPNGVLQKDPFDPTKSSRSIPGKKYAEGTDF